MKTIKGPAIFLAQFIGDKEPYNTLPGLAIWSSGLGLKGELLPYWADHNFNVEGDVCRDYSLSIKSLIVLAGY